MLLSQVENEPEFNRLIDSLVRTRLNQRPELWEELLRSLPGVDPIVVFESVQRQQLCSRIRRRNVTGRDDDSGHDSEFAGESYFLLPTPHPLDYSWWFDSASIATLRTRVDSAGGKTIVLFGTPTLAVHLALQSRRQRVVLVDKDPRTVERCVSAGVEAILGDLQTDDPPPVIADVVLADPPWYQEETEGFIRAARRSLRPGGTLFLTCAPLCTRPGISDEWRRVVARAAALGFELCGEENRAVTYISPLFEQNAFLAAGVPRVPSDWRHGGLATFRCVSEMGDVERVFDVQTSAWRDFIIGDVRIRVRLKTAGQPGDAVLRRISEADILPSISRRDPRRVLVDVWTSGNRVFACADTSLLIDVLTALQARSDSDADREEIVLSVFKDERLRSVVRQICNLLRTENREVRLWRMRHFGGGRRHF